MNAAEDDLMDANAARVGCEVLWHSSVDPGLAARAASIVLGLISDSGELLDLEMQISAGGGSPLSAEWVVGGVDRSHATHMAEFFWSTSTTFAPWCGLGPVRPVEHRTSSNPVVVHDLVEVSGQLPSYFISFAPSWDLAHRSSTRVEMVVRFGRLRVRADGVPLIGCSIEVRGDAAESAIVARAIALDSGGDVDLGVRKREPRADPPHIELPLTTLGWLASTPARIRGAWPSSATNSVDEAVQMLSRPEPPHAAVFGGSGPGTNALEEHLVDASHGCGETTVVISGDDDLAVRAAQILERREAPFDVVDFGSVDAPPFWAVPQPPSSVPFDVWPSELVEILVGTHVSNGSVSDRAGALTWRHLVESLVRIAAADPDGPLSVFSFVQLLDARIDRGWSERELTIDDALADAVELVESLRSVGGIDDELRVRLWIRSFLRQFTGTLAMRALVDQRTSSFDVSSVLQGRSLLVSVPSSVLGQEGASLVRTALLQHLRVVMRHASRERRRPVRLFLVNADSVDPSVLGQLVAEGHRLQIGVTILTSSPSLLSEGMLRSILANTGAIATFRVGVRDAEALDVRFPTVPVSVIQRLPRDNLVVANGDRDIVCSSPLPLADPTDRGSFDAQHRSTRLAFIDESTNRMDVDRASTVERPITRSDDTIDACTDDLSRGLDA